MTIIVIRHLKQKCMIKD